MEPPLDDTGDGRRPARSARGDGRRDGGAPDPPSFLGLANVLLRHRWVNAALVVGGGLLLVGAALLRPAAYTSTVRFVPQAAADGGSGLSGLARRFGVADGSGPPGGSPEFYATLVETRHLLAAAVRGEGVAGGPGADDTVTGAGRARASARGADERRRDLIGALGVSGGDSAERVDRAVRRLRDRLSVSTDRAGLVSVSVTTDDPGLSRRVAARIVELVNRFNLETRQSRAAEERRFLADRLAAARRELRAAEDSLRRFLERNRRFENSPRLVFERDRLRRRVELRQQVYTSLATRFEEAKIDEVRDTPVITVVDPAERPARPEERHLALRGVIGMLLGGLLGVVWSFGAEFARGSPAREPDDYREFVGLLERAKTEAREAGRRVLPGGRGPGEGG